MRKQYVIEARESATGHLKFDCEQPPSRWINGVSEKELFDYFFDCFFALNDEEIESANWEELRNWYAAKFWFIREKTW